MVDLQRYIIVIGVLIRIFRDLVELRKARKSRRKRRRKT